MKYLIGSLALISSFAMADINVDRQATAVRVDSATFEIIGHGHPITEVKVQATFSNPCHVPHSDELVKVVQYNRNYDVLDITLALDSERVCTQEYNPTPATINLGEFIRPNDGLFDTIRVNGVKAKKGN